MLDCDGITSDALDIASCEYVRKVIEDLRSETSGCQPCHVKLQAVESDGYHECVCAVQQVGAFIVEEVANAEERCRASDP